MESSQGTAGAGGEAWPVPLGDRRPPPRIAFAVARTAAACPSAVLARAAGITRWYLADLEAGRRALSADLLAQLYLALGRVQGAVLEATLPPPDDPARRRSDRLRRAWVTRRANRAQADRGQAGAPRARAAAAPRGGQEQPGAA